MKDHYFFFKDEMPIAVFLTEFKWESIKLFLRLYKHKSWRIALGTGISIIKEDDVPIEQWDRIHNRYKATEVVKEKQVENKRCSEVKLAQFKLPRFKPVEHGSVILESARYLRQY
jgi:hypothetical protein